MSKGTLLCLGFGYSAEAVAKRLSRDGDWCILGTTRAPEKAQELTKSGVTPLALSDASAVIEAPHAGGLHILVSTPPDDGGDPALIACAAALARAPNRVHWIGYLSTTGVYGDRSGDWVDEKSASAPTSERGRRRVDAENAWRSLAREHDMPLAIFRLGGIYGPGRSAIDQIREGRAKRIAKPGQVFNRIHVDDIAVILDASIEKDAALPDGQGQRFDSDAVYNAVDDQPTSQSDVIAFAAEALNDTPPPETPFHEADLTPMARSFYSENKRVRNDRIKSRLGVQLSYPTYREGLRAILRA